MKRFLADVVLVLILVSIGSYMSEQNHEKPIDIQAKINEFEADVSQQKPISAKVEGTSLHEIEENAASRFAKASSEVIVDIMDSGVSIFTELCRGIVE